MPAQAICTKCGAHFQPDAKFCGFDGVELLLGEVEGEPLKTFVNAKSCPDCARQYPSYANYCGVDGTGLEDSRAAIASGNGAKSKAAADSPSADKPAKGKASGKPKVKKETVTAKSVKPPKDEMLTVPVGTVASESMIGKVLDGKYRIESPLAEGGMAVLYLAKHEDMERTVVVKVIHQSLMYRSDMIERFKRECKIAARLNHPNVVSVYDFGLINDRQPYLVMEYIQGMSLSTMLTKQSRMSLQLSLIHI